MLPSKKMPYRSLSPKNKPSLSKATKTSLWQKPKSRKLKHSFKRRPKRRRRRRLSQQRRKPQNHRSTIQTAKRSLSRYKRRRERRLSKRNRNGDISHLLSRSWSRRVRSQSISHHHRNSQASRKRSQPRNQRSQRKDRFKFPLVSRKRTTSLRRRSRLMLQIIQVWKCRTSWK